MFYYIVRFLVNFNKVVVILKVFIKIRLLTFILRIKQNYFLLSVKNYKL